MSRGFARNALLSGMSWLIPAVAAVVAVPVIVNGLGTATYGIMALVAAVTGYLAIMDLGLANGVIRYIALFASEGNGIAIRGCTSTVLRWFAAVGVLGACAMWLSSPWLVGDLLKVPTALVSQAVVAFRIGGAAFGLGMLVSVLSLVPQAFLRYDLVAVLGGLISGASVAGPAVIVWLGYGLIPVMWYGVCLNGIAVVVWGIVALRLIRSVPLRGPGFAEFRSEFLHFSAASAANRIAGVVSLQTSRLVVGIAGGATLAGYYQVPMLVSSNVNGLINKMGTVVLPTGTHVVASGNHDEFISLYIRSSRLLYLLNASVSGAVIVFSAPLLREWVGDSFAQVGAAALAILTLAQLINAASIPASNLNLVMGRPRVNLFFSVAASVVSLTTVYWLTLRYGVTGTALAGLFGSILVPVFLYYSHSRILAVGSMRVLLECYLRPTMGVVVVCGLAWVGVRPHATSLTLTVLMAGLVAAVSFVVAAVFGGMTTEEWTQMRVILFARDRRKSAEVGESE